MLGGEQPGGVETKFWACGKEGFLYTDRPTALGLEKEGLLVHGEEGRQTAICNLGPHLIKRRQL